MMGITILTEAEIRKCIDMDREAVAAVSDGFSRLAAGEATVPPVLAIPVPENNGEVDVKTAYIKGLSGFVIKIAAGFYDNTRLGLPTGSGMMVVISAKTGFPEAILLDNGFLTSVRTGAAGAVAANYLAPKEIETAGVIGTGSQARYQIRGLKLVRDFRQLMVYGIVPDEVDRYAEEMGPLLGAEVIKAKNEETVVGNSQVVVTTTPSHKPHLRPEWLHPGLHITAMGADGENKQELYSQVLESADLLACDRKSQCFRLGELHHGLEEGYISRDDEILELGELTSGQKTGRRNDEQITVCDLTGVGVQDTAIGLLAYRKAVEERLGVQIKA